MQGWPCAEGANQTCVGIIQHELSAAMDDMKPDAMMIQSQEPIRSDRYKCDNASPGELGYIRIKSESY